MAKINKAFINNLVKDPFGVLQNLDVDDIVNVIQKANHTYYNQGKPLFNDQIFDVIKEHLANIVPDHPILKILAPLYPMIIKRLNFLILWEV